MAAQKISTMRMESGMVHELTGRKLSLVYVGRAYYSESGNK
jgi:hypothetical protein